MEGLRYEGEWANDKMNGYGKLDHPSGAHYEGNFVNNNFHVIFMAVEALKIRFTTLHYQQN